MKTEIGRQTKLIWKIVLAVAVTIMFFALSEETAKADEVTVNTWSGLQDAIDLAPNGTSRTIQLTADIRPAEPTASDAYITIGSDKKITLDLNGHIMNRGLALETVTANGMVIRVEGELTLDDSDPTSSHPGFSFTNPVTQESNTVTGGAITGGKNTCGGGVNVCAGARFIMNAGSIVACEAFAGGGVYVDVGEYVNDQTIRPYAEFIMNGGLITSCSAFEGGGVFNCGDYSSSVVYVGASFTMKGGSIEYCTARYTGGGIYSSGRFTMEGGKIRSCKAVEGGGIASGGNPSILCDAFVFAGGEIRNCESTEMGGGVCVEGKSIIMSGGKIIDCRSRYGGGVYYCAERIVAYMSGGEISGCEGSEGGGVYIDDGTFNMSDGKISGCECESSRGGGVYINDGTFNMSNGEISGCGCESSCGGGVYIEDGTFNMSDGEISGCGCESSRGGGVYVNLGTFNMSDGKISGCGCESSRGGGVYIEDGTFNMLDGEISGCEGYDGGGVYIEDGTFNMSDGEISGCEADSYGGGVYIEDGTFNMLDGEIRRCEAYSDGGGVYVDDGTFNMSGREIRKCEANDGGGVYVYNGTFNMSDGEISRCEAGFDGEGIYVGMSGLVLITGGNYLNVDLDLPANENEIKRENGSAFIVVKPVIASEYVSEHPLVTASYKTSIQDYYYVSQNGSDPGTVDFSSIATNAAWSSSIPKTSIPGTYEVWVAVKGNGKASGPIKLSPSSVLPKADPAFSTSPAAVENQVCDGTPKNLVSEGSFGSLVNSVNPTVLYAVTDTATRPDDNVFATGIPSKTESGTYYVWYRVEGDNYYNAKNNYDPITVEILEPKAEPAPAPVIVTPVNDPEPVSEEAKEEPKPAPKPAVFTRKNKDGSSTTITIIRNTDGTVTTVTENKCPDGITETKSETRDAKGNGTLSKTNKDADGDILSKTEGTIKVNKKETETLKSVTENSDGSTEEKTQKTYKRDADNIKKVTADTKKTDAEGNTEETKMTALVDGLGAATITESSTYTFTESDGRVVKEERQYSLSANERLKLLSLSTDGEKFTTPESIELDGMVRVVKSIGKNALKGNKTVREVVIGKDVTTICAGAFKNCSNLELIELTSSVKKIYKNAFKGIAKNARFVIEASEEDFARIVELLKASGVSDTVTFERK